MLKQIKHWHHRISFITGDGGCLAKSSLAGDAISSTPLHPAGLPLKDAGR